GCEGIVRPLRPHLVKIFIGPAAKQQGAGIRHALSNSLGYDAIVYIGLGPAAVLEAAAAVFVGPGRRLHDAVKRKVNECHDSAHLRSPRPGLACRPRAGRSRSEGTRLNSSHVAISYAVFCLKKKKKTQHKTARQLPE